MLPMRLMTLIGFMLISLLSAPEVWGTSDYTYDALGNMRLYEVDDFRHNRHIVQDYTYDARNRMVSTTYEAGITETYSFDSYGRITIGHNRTTHYDVAHRPTSVVHNNGRTDSFIYDGNLHRAKETIFHKTRYSVYGQGGTLLFRDNITDGETTDYVRLGGHTIARLKTDSAGVTTVTYPHTNHLGSPVAATDATGDLLWREEYTPFGRKHENAPGQRGEEGFTGHIFDGQNTVHMKARTYMTTSYRFTTPDPVTFLSSGLDPAYFNRYAYVGNDPVNAIDPDGRQTTALGSPFLKSLGNPNSKARQVVRTGVVAGSLAVPGPEDAVIAAAGATKIGQGIKAAAGAIGRFFSKGGGKVDVGDPSISIGNTPDAAGFPGSPTTQTSEVGTIHTDIPGRDGPMDVRVMNGRSGSTSGDRNGPRLVTTRAGTNDGVRADGSKFKNNESASERRAGCHTSLECN